MAQIGTFTDTGKGYSGQLHTLTSNAHLTLEPNRQSGANGPAFRIFHGVHEVGIAFKKTGKDSGKPYLLCLIDDPSFSKPIWANLIISTENAEIPLMWDRPQPKKAEAIAA